jgi:hypothetical protein
VKIKTLVEKRKREKERRMKENERVLKTSRD